MRRLSILGSTGSIGRQTLEVVTACGYSVAALTANKSIDLLEQQARQYHPELVVAVDETAATQLKQRLSDTDITVASGMEGVTQAATLDSADTVVTAIVGVSGLIPTLAAIRQGKRIALANKETLVCAGELVMAEAERYGAEIVPVDSEHSAIFQCLQGSQSKGEVKRLILTASGGPFYGWKKEQLAQVTKAQALKHPNWSMGAKITIDSATLMNKGLEFIEAMRLYQLPAEQISIVVHRESIVHSFVEYCDNAILAQMGSPDMRMPIQYALTWPDRTPGPAEPLDLLSCKALTFGAPDLEAFPCLALAIEAAKKGGTAPATLNGANEAAVELFLQEQIGFLDIPARVAQALAQAKWVAQPSLEQLLEADREARAIVLEG